eukprot:396578_1
MNQFEVFVGVFLAFTLVFIASLYMKYGRNNKCEHCNCDGNHSHNNNDKRHLIITKQASSDKPDLMDQLARLLKQNPNETVINQSYIVAKEIINKLLPKNVKLATNIQLKLYGSYKQVEVGDINKPKPSQLNVQQHAKWKAWNEQKGKNKIEAQKEYFFIVYNVMKQSGLTVLQSNIENTNNMNNGGGRGFDGNVMKKTMSRIGDNEDDKELYGHPNELFNRFDLTQDDDVNINEIKKYIETNKININKQNENGTTFLNFAADNEKYHVCKLLIQQFKVDVNLS